MVCLDSGCGNYDQLWCTTSLRGLAGGNLTVKVLEEGVHSGDASGIVPSSFRIIRQLLSRIEDEKTGKVLVDDPTSDGQITARMLHLYQQTIVAFERPSTASSGISPIPARSASAAAPPSGALTSSPSG